MGCRYCAINSPLGPRWGQKSLDLRSRDFCPHLEPRGELIAQYRPPMSFRYRIPRLVTGGFIDLWYRVFIKLAFELGYRARHLKENSFALHPHLSTVSGDQMNGKQCHLHSEISIFTTWIWWKKNWYKCYSNSVCEYWDLGMQITLFSLHLIA